MAHVIYAQEMYFPLQSTQALSAYLKKAGHTTNLALGSPKEIVEFCKKEKSDLVAFSVLTSYRNHMMATADELKEAIQLREMDGLSYEEISDLMNCPIGTVRSRIFRAREAIAEKLKPLIETTNKRW